MLEVLEKSAADCKSNKHKPNASVRSKLKDGDYKWTCPDCNHSIELNKVGNTIFWS